ncbi:choice-of-anchor M domain-containing protein [Solirubrobacter phytolaccae]|uniref:Choice-of-anchor M domain-containing protein n=1 Tax=Solirubrobacter phytolaccae TaxID=1404360 RepID=A0A9X3S9M3_9ACTN|nr:choice-of-anchor M domain-containing protein [Solirubrobacter phytolaccae]MDA0181626.1 choice-of-anchor M domain-containing protein [Solirubrobacter phytolaccae]
MGFRNSCVAAAVGPLVGLLLGPPAFAAPPPVVADSGQYQITPRLTATGIDLGLWRNPGTTTVPGADGGPVLDLADVTVNLKAERVHVLPADAGWRVFGPRGADAYETGLPPDAADVALGFNSNLIPRAQLSTATATRNITYKIVEARVPGRAMIAPRAGTLVGATTTPPSPSTSSFDPTLPGVNQRGEVAGYQPFQFNNVGVYCLGLQAGAYLANQTPVTSAVETLRIVVGDWEDWGDKECGAGPELPSGYYEPDAVNQWDPATNKLLPVSHVDLAPYLNDSGQLEAGLHESAQGWDRWWSPANTVVFVPEAAAVTIPEPTATADFGFLGAPGDRVWRIPASASAGPGGTPALGYSGEEFEATDFAGRPQWRLDAVTGLDGGPAPGAFFLGTNETEVLTGGAPHFSTRQGLPQSRGFRSGSHVHANWDFTAPGTYCLSMTFSGWPAGKTYRTSTERVLTVVVGGTTHDPAGTRTCEQAQHDGNADFPAGTPAATPVAATPGRTVLAPPAGRQGFATFRVSGPEVELVHGSQTGGGVTYDPDDVVLSVDGAHAVSEPGLEAVWGAGRRQSLVAGVGTFKLGLSALDGPLTWSLGAVRGPGKVDFVSPDAPLRLSTVPELASASGVVRPDTTVAGDWRFEVPGVYCLPMTWTAADGTTAVTKTLAVAVGVSADGVQPGVGCVGSTGGGGGPDPDPGPDPGTGSGRTVLARGHVDISSTLDADRLVQTIDDGGVDREIDSVTLHVRPAAERRTPADPAYAFLGVPGAPVWLLPQSQDEGLLWPGWTLRPGTRALSSENAVRWELGAVRGPGRFVLYQNDGFGLPQPRLGQGSAFTFSGHGHGTWAFTADGAYCLPITATEVVTGHVATFTLLVAVGQVDAGAVTPADCGKSARELGARTPEPEPTATPTPTPESAPSPVPAPRPAVVTRAKAPSVSVRTKPQRLDRKRVARLATLVCPAGRSCRVSTPSRVRVTIASKRFDVQVLAPRSLRAGTRGSLRVRVPAAAARRLAGRQVRVRVPVKLSGSRSVTRTVAVTIRG